MLSRGRSSVVVVVVVVVDNDEERSCEVAGVWVPGRAGRRMRTDAGAAFPREGHDGAGSGVMYDWYSAGLVSRRFSSSWPRVLHRSSREGMGLGLIRVSGLARESLYEGEASGVKMEQRQWAREGSAEEGEMKRRVDMRAEESDLDSMAQGKCADGPGG